MPYVTRHLGIEIEYTPRNPDGGVVDLDIKPMFVQECFTPNKIGVVTIDGKFVSKFEPFESEDMEALEKLRQELEIETVIPYTIFNFAALRVKRLNAELEECRAALKLAQTSLKELIPDVEVGFGPAYGLQGIRKDEALRAAKKALRPLSIHDLINKSKAKS